jgi:hypothetical protein
MNADESRIDLAEEIKRSEEQGEARELTYRMAKNTPRSGRPPRAPAGSTSSLNRSPSQPSHRTVPSAPTGCTAVTPRAHLPVSICESAPPGAGHLTLTAAAPGHAAGRPSSLAGPTRTPHRRAPAGDFRATIPADVVARDETVPSSCCRPGLVAYRLIVSLASSTTTPPPTQAGRGAGRRLLSLGRVAVSLPLAAGCPAPLISTVPRRHAQGRPRWLRGPLIAAPHGIRVRTRVCAGGSTRGQSVRDTASTAAEIGCGWVVGPDSPASQTALTDEGAAARHT